LIYLSSYAPPPDWCRFLTYFTRKYFINLKEKDLILCIFDLLYYHSPSKIAGSISTGRFSIFWAVKTVKLYFSRILDGGALGIIVPHVKSVQDVKAIIQAAKFQPVGNRSEMGAMPHFQYRPLPARIACPSINEATLVIPMIETLETLAVVNDIAAVPGVDALFLGSSDLVVEMGIPGGFGDERFVEAYERVINACNENDILAGIGGLQSRPELEKLSKMRVRWVSAATDSGLFFGAAVQKCKEVTD
jgi:2-keto-3-deoxy-L-rhamnonate aldolase RhmA